MRMNITALALVATTVFALACNKDNSSAAPSGSASAASQAPTATGTTTAAMAGTTAAPTAAAAPAAIPGIKPGEMVAGVCDTISKDSECTEFMVMSEGDKAKELGDVKKLCPTATATGACPAAKQVVTCRIMKDLITHYYADGPKNYTKDTGATQCKKNMGHAVE